MSKIWELSSPGAVGIPREPADALRVVSGGGRGDRCRWLSGVVIFALASFLVASSAGAAGIFFEDFEGIPDAAFTADGGRTKLGLPLVSEGAMETWYGGRFEPPDGGKINHDIVVRDRGDVFPAQNKYARFEDDAGMLLHVSTVGFSNVELSFDWLTHAGGTSDLLTVGYRAGAIAFPGPAIPSSHPNAAYMRDFDTSGPSWNTWTELMQGAGSSSWANATYALPAEEANLWVAFWINGGEHDYGKIDNIEITATVVPEAGTALLLAAGLAGLGLRRRR